MSKANSASTSTNTTPSSGDGSAIRTGVELMNDMVTAKGSLDRFLDRDPHAQPLLDQELMDLVTVERKLRASWNVKLEKRQAKKQGVEE